MTGRMIALLAVLYLSAIGMAIALSSLFLKVWRRKQGKNAMSALHAPANSQPASAPEGNRKRGYFWAIVLVVFAVLGFVFAMVFSEVILASALYVAWINAVTSATRLPDEMANALTIVLVSVFCFALWPYVARSLFRHRGETKRTRLMLASFVLATFFVGKHYVSQPGPDEYFNSVTGAPMWKYYTSDEGLIVQAPLYKKFNTQDGSLLKLMDPAVAKAHREQEKKRQADPPVQPQAGQGQTEEQPQPKDELRLPDAHSAQAKEIANALGDNKPFKAEPATALSSEGVCSYTRNAQYTWEPLPYGKFEMRVDSVSLTEDWTIIGVVVRLPAGEGSRREFHDFSNTAADGNESEYLVDSNQLCYPIKSSSGDFPIALKPTKLRKEFLSVSELSCEGFLANKCAFAKMFFPGEEYHFWLRFPKLSTYWPEFKLGVHHFPPITIKFVE